MARPEILFPLFADLTTLPGIGAKTAQSFAKLGVANVRDLLFLIPHGIIDRRLREDVQSVDTGQVVTVRVQIIEHRRGRTEKQPYRVVVQGGGTLFELVFFHAKREWIERLLPIDTVRVVSGRAEIFDGRLQIAHPDFVLTEADAQNMPSFEPVYPLTQGITQKTVRKAVAGAMENLPPLPEWQRPDTMREFDWPGWADALAQFHDPQDRAILAPGAPARARLAYDELLSHQLALGLVRARMRKGAGRVNTGDGALRAKAEAAFGFPPTKAQRRAIEEIAGDMAADTRMLRLLQGDVGSGKTWVAMMAMLIAVEAGGQAALMAPTEILARQHASGLGGIAEKLGLELVLLSGRDTGANRRAKLAAISDGTARLIVGTHALFQKDVAFNDLRLAVIDEQHRFGVRQRMELAAKAPAGADLLVMTATPIPRTLALTGYGDLDFSILDEKPPGRQPIETRLVSRERIDEVIDRLDAALKSGAQAYWVCPLVEESEVAPLISAEDRHAALAKRLGADRVALVHGQMPAEQKDAAMLAFQAGETQLLVATTVIEVGVDVPQATIMVIEQAEIFGLSQLHQLRGRVGRGAGRSSCLLLYDAPLNETAKARLEVMRATEDGFAIAEEDLRLRGPGDFLGTAQSGAPVFHVADLERDKRLMDRARDETRLILHEDPDLSSGRGKALKTLLYLMDRDASVRLMNAP
ncbi:ATP-dependent DNA helicase RecG [Rhodobacteraceae bacterium NNCM2]|nr:ATP-dependent DNA helicase RecG [Coraliihabitans acroporae]